jgi:hypothetical protein
MARDHIRLIDGLCKVLNRIMVAGSTRVLRSQRYSQCLETETQISKKNADSPDGGVKGSAQQPRRLPSDIKRLKRNPGRSRSHSATSSSISPRSSGFKFTKFPLCGSITWSRHDHKGRNWISSRCGSSIRWRHRTARCLHCNRLGNCLVYLARPCRGRVYYP